MIGMYILKDGIAYPCEDLIEWVGWMGQHQFDSQRVDTVGGLRLSTVFLGLDHSFNRRGDPILWESMLFDDEAAHGAEFEDMNGKAHKYTATPDRGQWRFSFMNDAYEFHDEKLAELQNAFDKSKAPFRFGEHKES